MFVGLQYQHMHARCSLEVNTLRQANASAHAKLHAATKEVAMARQQMQAMMDEAQRIEEEAQQREEELKEKVQELEEKIEEQEEMIDEQAFEMADLVRENLHRTAHCILSLGMKQGMEQQKSILNYFWAKINQVAVKDTCAPPIPSDNDLQEPYRESCRLGMALSLKTLYACTESGHEEDAGDRQRPGG